MLRLEAVKTKGPEYSFRILTNGGIGFTNLTGEEEYEEGLNALMYLLSVCSQYYAGATDSPVEHTANSEISDFLNRAKLYIRSYNEYVNSYVNGLNDYSGERVEKRPALLVEDLVQDYYFLHKELETVRGDSPPFKSRDGVSHMPLSVLEVRLPDDLLPVILPVSPEDRPRTNKFITVRLECRLHYTMEGEDFTTAHLEIDFMAWGCDGLGIHFPVLVRMLGQAIIEAHSNRIDDYRDYGDLVKHGVWRSIWDTIHRVSTESGKVIEGEVHRLGFACRVSSQERDFLAHRYEVSGWTL